ncbi:MAG: hypothetical protein QOK31_596 [Solirubrobacteraceae bacterium]|nr:hypothetical protein [Solirubrobacteraceae bacterium]
MLRRLPVLFLVCAAAAALVAIPAQARRAGAASARPWSPGIHAAAVYARHRHGSIAFAVRTEHRSWSYRGTRIYPSASVVKAMLLVTYLDHRYVRGRPLTHRDRALLTPMIRRSDDRAAQRIFEFVGRGGLRALARRVGMRRFHPAHIWGRSLIDAVDQTKFFLHIDRFLVSRHRAFAMKLLASVIPSQRWGVGRVRPRGWSIYFKGGWGAGTGWVDHQIALYKRGVMRLSIAILTHNDGSHAYGKATLKGIAARLLRGLGPNSSVR